MLELRKIILFHYNLFFIFCSSIPDKPQSGLCNKYDSSCKVKLLNETTDTSSRSDNCIMEYFERNSTACANLNFEDKICNFPGEISLNTYLFTKEDIYNQVAFNLSFTKINWKSMQFRYHQNGKKNEINYCRRFNLNQDLAVDPNSILFHDCLINDKSYEKFTYNLEILADNKFYKKFTFFVPYHERYPSNLKQNKSNVEVFMYVDVTDPQNLVLNFELLPSNLNIESYKIILEGQGKKEEEIEYRTQLDSSREKGIKQIPFKTHIRNSPYMFKIIPNGGNCGNSCVASMSPIINLANPFILSQIGIGIIIFCTILLIACAIAFFAIKMKLIKLIKKPVEAKPIVLFIYKATHKSHVKVIDSMCAYLESQGIIVLLDRRDILKSSVKDPYNWFLDAFSKADVVLVFSNLQCCPSDIVGVHRRLDDVALSQLKGAVAEGNHRFASVILPYCDKKMDVPIEASKFKLFSMPTEVSELVDFIKVNKGMNRLITNINMNINKTEYDTKLNDLKFSIKDAMNILSKHKPEEPMVIVNLKMDSEDDLDEDNMEEIKLFDSNKIGKHLQDPDNDNIYPNLNQLNLMGEDQNNLIPNQNKNWSDGPSNINFDDMRL